MAEDRYPVEWVGRQAVMRLPDHIDLSNVNSIGAELLALINRGAAALIVDMTATASCDDAGAETLVRAYKRAIANGAQLRLVVPAEVVRRVLSATGLDRLVSVYPSREPAIAAGVPVTQASRDVLDTIVGDLFHAGLSLQAALDSADEAGRPHIMEALQYLDGAIRAARDQVFTVARWEILPGREPPDGAQ